VVKTKAIQYRKLYISCMKISSAIIGEMTQKVTQSSSVQEAIYTWKAPCNWISAGMGAVFSCLVTGSRHWSHMTIC